MLVNRKENRMKIETKYNIGDHIWNVYAHRGEVMLYDAYIHSISIDKNGFLYYCNDGAYTEIEEEDIILYDEKDKLVAKIEQVMQEIHEREEKENENN